jgi:hypothetical protein
MLTWAERQAELILIAIMKRYPWMGRDVPACEALKLKYLEELRARNS